jgi:hypothetical protein
VATGATRGGPVTSLTDGGYLHRGTIVTFPAPHTLDPSDRISISGVETFSGDGYNEMFNSEFEIITILSPLEVLINVVFPLGAFPTSLNVVSAVWWRSNRIQFEQINIVEAGEFLVCWSPDGSTGFVSSAGTITVVSPVESAGVLTIGTVSPSHFARTRLSFTTAQLEEYETFSELRIVTPGGFDILDTAGGGVIPSTKSTARLDVCGLFLLEINTPYPIGCYVFDDSTTGSTVRNFAILFSEPLLPATEYEIVVMGRGDSGLSPTDTGVVELLALDNESIVIEKIQLRPDKTVLANVPGVAATLELNSGVAVTMTKFCRSGVDLQCMTCSTDSDCGIGENICVAPADNACKSILGLPVVSQFKFAIIVSAGSVTAVGSVRVLLGPITQWSLPVGESVLIQCVAISVGSSCGIVTATIDSPNSFVFTLGSTIDLTHLFEFRVDSLEIPGNGFLDGSVQVEIVYGGTTVVGMDPVDFFSVTEWPDDAVMIEQPHPSFASDSSIELLLQITPPFDIAGGSVLEIALPTGYVCGMVPVAGCVGVECDFLSSGIGSRTSEAEQYVASWSSSGSVCSLNLGPSTRIFRGSKLDIPILVSNPGTPMAANVASNRWTVSVSRNSLSSSLSQIPGVAVLGRLGEVSATPTFWEIGENWVYIFFKTQSVCEEGVRVRVDAPDGFEFSEVCSVVQVDEIYFSPESENSLRKLPEISGCSATPGETSETYNIAHVALAGPLEAGERYAFKIRVLNPITAENSGWRISTFSEFSACDGMESNAPWVAAGSGSWYPVIHSMTGSQFRSEFDSLVPGRTTVRIFFTAATAGVKRITIAAPPGFLWDYGEDEFLFGSILEGIEPGKSVTGLDRTLPLISVPPLSVPRNMLLIPNLITPLEVGKVYGFEARIIVPSTVPTYGANYFIIQLSTPDGMVREAGSFAGPLIHRMMFVSLQFDNGIRGEENEICLKFSSPISLPAGEVVSVTPPAGFTPAACSPADAPTDSTCSIVSGVIRVTGGPSGFALVFPESYHWCWEFTNPNSLVPVAPDWEIQSTSLAPVLVAGFTINEPMPIAGIDTTVIRRDCDPSGLVNTTCSIFDEAYWTTTRDDRPGRINNILFWLSVPAAAAGPSVIEVIAPVGFEFPFRCRVDLTDPLNSTLAIPSEFSSFGGITVTECDGSGSGRAVITFSSDLPVGQKLLWRMDGIRNPIIAQKNTWKIGYKTFASHAIPGIQLWEFMHASVTPADTAIAASNLIRLEIIPLNTVPEGGFIAVEAPEGFVIDTLCSVRAEGVGTAVCEGTQSGGDNRFVISGFNEPLASGEKYLFWISVFNPSVSDVAKWQITSYAFDSPDGVIDTSVVPGFPLAIPFGSFVLNYVSSVVGNAVATYMLQFSFPTDLQVNDVISVGFPEGFVLNSTADCSGYVYLVPLSSAVGLQTTIPSCEFNRISWTVPSFQPTLAGQTMGFSIVTVNPLQTPAPNLIGLTLTRSGIVLASRTIAGAILMPSIHSVVVVFGTPSVVSAGGAGGCLEFSFISPVAGDSVRIMGKIRDTDSSFATQVVEGVDIVANELFNATLEELTNPSSAGQTSWTIEVFSGIAMVSRITETFGPTIVGRIEVIPVTSYVVPKTYTSVYSLVTFNITSTVPIRSQSLISLTPPPGYAIYESSFQEIQGVISSWQKLDGIYHIRVDFDIPGNTPVAFGFYADLPAGPEKITNWRIDVMSVGEILIGSNDGQFSGFVLVALAPFSVVPENYSPGAPIEIVTTFSIAAAVTGVNLVSVQITAPAGFVFMSNCFASDYTDPTSSLIACDGSGNVAIMTTIEKLLPAGTYVARLRVTNAVATPVNNNWLLAVYPDTEIALTANADSTPGYTILAMPAVYIGGNRLGALTTGFFTFTLTRPVQGVILVQITPKPQSNYVLLCEPVLHVGCTGGEDSNAMIQFEVSELTPDFTFTIGMAVNNPTLPVVGGRNFFEVVVIDKATGSTLDSNLEVAGENLRSVLMSGTVLKYDTAAPRSLSNVIVGFTLEADLVSTSDTEFVTITISAPISFSISSASSVTVSATNGTLPLSDVLPIAVADNVLTLILEPAVPAPVGNYSVQLPVMNPREIPSNNVWTLNITNSGSLAYLVPIAGYQFD